MSANKVGGSNPQGIQGTSQPLSQTAKTQSSGPLTFGKVMSGIGRVLLSVVTLGIYDLCKAISSYKARQTPEPPSLLQQSLAPKESTKEEIRQHNAELADTISQPHEGRDYVDLAFAVMRRIHHVGGPMSSYRPQDIAQLRHDISQRISTGGGPANNMGFGEKSLTLSEANTICQEEVTSFIVYQHNKEIGANYVDPHAQGPQSFTGIATELAGAKDPQLDLTGIDLSSTLNKIKESIALAKNPMTAEQIDTMAREKLGQIIDIKHAQLESISRLRGISDTESKALSDLAKTTDIKSLNFFTELWAARAHGTQLTEALASNDQGRIMDALKTFCDQTEDCVRQFSGDPVATSTFMSEVLRSIFRETPSLQQTAIAQNFQKPEFAQIMGTCAYVGNSAAAHNDMKSYASVNQLSMVLAGLANIAVYEQGGQLPPEPMFNSKSELPQPLLSKLESFGVKVY